MSEATETSPSPTVSVVIPALDSADTLGDTLRSAGAQTAAGCARGHRRRQRFVGRHRRRRPGPRCDRPRGTHAGAERGPQPRAAPRARRHRRPRRRGHRAVTPVGRGHRVAVRRSGGAARRRPQRQLPPAERAAERYIAASGTHRDRARGEPGDVPVRPVDEHGRAHEAALEIGGWSEDLRTAEDVDFSFRLCRARRCAIAYAADAIVLHRNRDQDDALRRQAWTYGEGAAALYRRYPGGDRLVAAHPRDAGRSAGLRARYARRCSARRRRAGLCSAEQLEFAALPLAWTSSYWRGFANRYWRAGWCSA